METDVGGPERKGRVRWTRITIAIAPIDITNISPACSLAVTGERLRRLRERLGLTQEALAHLLGVAFATVNRWENVAGVSGPRGAVAVVLNALEVGLRRDRELPRRLSEWGLRGQPYLMHRLFALAYGRGSSSATGRSQ